MQQIFDCIKDSHDPFILALAGLVCVLGVYGAFSVSQHALKARGRSRVWLGLCSLVAAGCTAWATHMVALLAYEPGMPAGFEPVLTAASLLFAIVGLAIGLAFISVRPSRVGRSMGGVSIGVGIVLLHYVGQYAFVVRGRVEWDATFVVLSVILSLPLFGLSLVFGGERNRSMRRLAAPTLLLAICVLHLLGMSALHLTYDPRILLPSNAIEADILAPIVAAVCIGLLGVSLFGLQMTLRLRARMRADQKRLGELSNLALEGLAICEDERILSANAVLSQLSGYSLRSLVGRDITYLLPKTSLSDIKEDTEIDAELIGKNGTAIPVRLLRREFTLGRKAHTVLAFRDQRERMRSEARIRMLAYMDMLTGLANRERFNETIETCVTEFAESQTPFTVMLIDLDGFKFVNDTIGHSSGDAVLKIVAERLRQAVGDACDLARLSGDEFVAVIPDCNDPLYASTIAERVIRLINETIIVNDQDVLISASIGLATIEPRYDTAEKVMRNADLALYDAKGSGRSCVRIFHEALRNAANERSNVSREIEAAFADGDLEVYYQPQVRLSDGALTGAEALLRWNYPYRGILSPAAFLPVLESGPLAAPVGNWVLRTACEQAARWRASGAPDFQIGVNLFGAQLRLTDFTETVQTTLDICGLPPEALELEVTENIILSDQAVSIARIENLRALGVEIAFDDFGTGYASLAMLKSIPITRLKIDRSFIQDVETNPQDQAIVEAISRMADGFGLSVIAEGIETANQARFIAPFASQAQGYLYGKPMTARAFEAHFKLSSKVAAA